MQEKNISEKIKELVFELRRQSSDDDFNKRMCLRLDKEEYIDEMIRRLKEYDDNTLSQSDTITMVMDITKKAELVLEAFKKLNPDIKL